MKNNKGIAPIIILLIALGVLAVGGGGYYAQKKGVVDVPLLRNVIKSERNVVQNQSETGHKGEQKKENIGEVASWQVYHDDKNGFEFKYPSDTYALVEVKEKRIAGIENALHGIKLLTLAQAAKVEKKEKCMYGLSGQSVICNANQESGILFVPVNKSYDALRMLNKNSDFQNITIGGKDGSFFEMGAEGEGAFDYFVPLDKNTTLFIERMYRNLDERNGDQKTTFEKILGTVKFFEKSAAVDTSNWKTYRNEKYGFEFQYPTDHRRYVKEEEGGKIVKFTSQTTAENATISVLGISSEQLKCPFSTHEIDCKKSKTSRGLEYLRTVNTGQLQYDKMRTMHSYFVSSDAVIDVNAYISDVTGKDIDNLDLVLSTYNKILDTFRVFNETTVLSPKITSGLVNSPVVMANRLRDIGFPAKTQYSDFADLINDIKSKNSNVAKVIGEINVVGLSGYEVSIDGIAGAWVVKDGVLYTYYFGKKGPLSSVDKQALKSITVPSR